jgi:hypothetical protein
VDWGPDTCVVRGHILIAVMCTGFRVFENKWNKKELGTEIKDKTITMKEYRTVKELSH